MDTQSLQTFQQFVDFVKNIDNYSTIVAQIKVATDAHTIAFDKLTQAKTLDQFRKTLDAVKVQLDMERKEFDKSCQSQLDSFKSRAKVLDATESALNDQASNQKEVQVLLDSKFAALDQRTVDLDKREKDLNDQIAINNKVAQDLADKAKKLSAILN